MFNLSPLKRNWHAHLFGIDMASEFYLVHHIFKPDMAKTWWEHPDGDLNEEEREKRTKRWFDAGFVNHCFMPMSKDGPMYCVWEVKDGVSATNFQDFLDSPGGVERTGCKTINNVVMKVDLELTGGAQPYERKFK